jgi:CRISPR-associated endonuclease Cas3-HD
MTEYFAHSSKGTISAQTYKVHIENVLELALKYARGAAHYSAKDGRALTELAGVSAFWHDLGKLHGENQAVLSGKKNAKNLPHDHEDAGAALLCGQNLFAAATVCAHHTGYRDRSEERKREKYAYRVSAEIGETSKLLDDYVKIHEKLLGRLENDIAATPSGDVNVSVFLRLLLSCVVDADHTDTARHYGNYPAGDTAIKLHPAERLAKLDKYVAELSAKSPDTDARAALRDEMYSVCRDLEMSYNVKIAFCGSPVGSGKTTALMAHLLALAKRRGLRRIFVILPFTNIIDQSVKVYRKALVLPGENPENVVAALHHRADFENAKARHLTALWRAPIIVTTAAAFFETLASNKPSVLRKLHELPGSAVFVDESHAALPAKLLPLAWKWMNAYAEEWGCHWVLASGSLCRFWEIPEIAQNTAIRKVPEIIDEDMRRRLSTYESRRINYCHDLSPKDAGETVNWVISHPGPRLVIVNTVNNAATLASAFKARFGRGEIEHLSTALTPSDRETTLERVRKRLGNATDDNWTLVATSCVEAGVDISFRTGFRELGSLASLLQLAGRVNREGKYSDTEVWTFTLSGEFNSNPDIKDAVEVLRRFFRNGADISPDLCTTAIQNEIRRGGLNSAYKELIELEEDLGFLSVKEKFKVIENDTRLAVVDSAIAERIKKGTINWRELLKNSVQIREDRLNDKQKILNDIYLWDSGYDDFLGYMKGMLDTDN